MDTEPDDEPTIEFKDIEAQQRSKELGITQQQTMDLRPWQLPTCNFFWRQDAIEDVLAAGPKAVGAGGEFQCATLAKKLLEAGLSLYEPDPERALNDPDYRHQIKDRVRRIKSANKNKLTDQTIEFVMKLAPYPIMREEAECAEFRMLLRQYMSPDLAACEEVMLDLWEEHREAEEREMELHRKRNSIR